VDDALATQTALMKKILGMTSGSLYKHPASPPFSSKILLLPSANKNESSAF